ncbi:MAG: sigma-70 family RNA polymerase sigma factor [Gemmatimonadaceae bacterium]
MREQMDVTELLKGVNQGDPEALNDAVVLLYDQLRQIAHRQLAREEGGHTLDTGGLVHEAYLRLLGVERVQYQDREHLVAMAARAMRRVLIDYADRRRAQKRGGAGVSAPIDAAVLVAEERGQDLTALDEALDRLDELAPRQCRIVECRFFVGLTVEETATALGVSRATVNREWTAARAWLNRELHA